jgi:hypothetical protein
MSLAMILAFDENRCSMKQRGRARCIRGGGPIDLLQPVCTIIMVSVIHLMYKAGSGAWEAI